MLKKIMVLYILLAISICIKAETEETIDINGGFEKKEEQQAKPFPAGWKVWRYVSDGNVEIIGDAYEGENALKLDAIPGKNGLLIMSKTFPVKFNDKLYLRLVLKGSNVNAMMILFDENGKQLKRIYRTASAHSDQWNIVTLGYPVTIRNVSSAQLYVGCAQGGKATIDALTLYRKKQDFNSAEFPVYKPLIDYGNSWKLGKHWKSVGQIGNKDFYFAEQGNYWRWKEKNIKPLFQTGLLQKMIPGHWNLKYFDPEEYAKVGPAQKKMVDDYLKNKWPLHSIQYITFRGNPVPSKETMERVKDIYLGDGQPEEPIYRLEPVAHYMKTGKLWQGSSMYIGKKEAMVDYFKNIFMPELKKAIPDCENPNKKWTGREVKELCDIYCDTYTRKIPSLIWTMYLSPYSMANNPKVKTIAEKGCDARGNAVARGIMRQSGGNKFFYTWRGHEPTERFGYTKVSKIGNLPSRESWGVSLVYLKYYIFRPYLCGANWFMTEGMPATLIEDIDEDGNFSLTPLGEIAMDMLDYSERHPDRGVSYNPVALLARWDMDSTIFKVNDYDFDAKSMNTAFMHDLLFTGHRHSKLTGGYNYTAPYGEIIDLLKPNPYKKIDLAIFDGYKLLIMMGGQKVTKGYASSLEDYVRNGGNLMINAQDAKDAFSEDFLGVKIGKKYQADSSKNLTNGKRFDENEFTAYELFPLKNTKVLYATVLNNKPLVTLATYGKGHVVLVGPRYMVQNKIGKLPYLRNVPSRYNPNRKPLLKFVPDLFEGVFARVIPFEIRIRPQDKEDISWVINKKGNGWTIALFNYSNRREELMARTRGTACSENTYPYKEIPFEIISHDSKMNDVMELYGDRDVNGEKINGKMTVRETIHGGEIRVYEFQPQKIKIPIRERFVNYALKKPVKASSVFKHYKPELAVDGKLDNNMFWGSDMVKRSYVLPQWIEIDLGQEQIIDHIFVKLHHWKNRRMTTRKFIVQYIVEASADGKNWTTVIDESKNIARVSENGLQRWFKPLKARYIKLTVTKNSGYSGAQVVEIKVMGSEKEKFQPERKSIKPKWEVILPAEIKNAPKKKVLWLIDLKPEKAEVGWIFAGKTWEDMKGEVKLHTGEFEGLVCPKSLFAESVSDIIYDIPKDAKWFVAIPGLGAPSIVGSVEFEVHVDGKLKYKSPEVVRVGQRLVPVIVEVSGAKKLHLHVTDGGDGIRNDYSWWGDARFILK